MIVNLSFTDIIIGFGGFAALLVSLAFCLKTPKNHLPNLWLSGFFLANTYVIIEKFFVHSGLIYEFPHLLRFKFPIGLLRPGFFFLFILYLTKDYKKISWYHLLHFLPSFLVLGYLLPFIVLSVPEKVAWLKGSLFISNANLPLWYLYFINIYSTIYFGLSLHLYIKLRKNLKSNNNLIGLILAGSSIYLLLAYLNALFINNDDLNYLMYQFLSIGFLFICFKMLSVSYASFSNTDRKYNSSQLSKKESEKTVKKIYQILNTKKLYTKSSLRIQHLADEMQMPAYLLSQVINQQTGMPFNDFINKFRIDEAVRLLEDDDNNHLTIEAIGYDAGFNSRTAFYNAFKKIKNCTPTTYREKQAA